MNWHYVGADVIKAAGYFGKTPAEWANAEGFTDKKWRGVVYAWCNHDDKMGYQRCNAASGTIG